MSGQDDDKFAFKAPEDNVRKWKPKEWESSAFQGVSPFDFAMRQKNDKLKVKEMEKAAKATMYNYEGKGVTTLSEMNAQNVGAMNQKHKEAAKQQKQEAMTVNMATSGFGAEHASRNADHARELKSKETQRQTKGDLKSVNMAAAGFGVEQASRNADHNRDKAWKDTQRQEKESQKNVNMAAAGFGVEQASRNADHNRDKAWKETQRTEAKKRNEFDMAKALF